MGPPGLRGSWIWNEAWLWAPSRGHGRVNWHMPWQQVPCTDLDRGDPLGETHGSICIFGTLYQSARQSRVMFFCPFTPVTSRPCFPPPHRRTPPTSWHEWVCVIASDPRASSASVKERGRARSQIRLLQCALLSAPSSHPHWFNTRITRLSPPWQSANYMYCICSVHHNTFCKPAWF